MADMESRGINDKEKIKKLYASLSDERLAELISNGADAFTAIGWQLLTREAERRGLLAGTTLPRGVVGPRRSLYDVLGIDFGADSLDIKAAYRRQAKEWHPDRRGGSKEAEEQFKLIAAAYEVLRDPQTRARYDATLLHGLDFNLEQYFVDFQRASDLFAKELKQTAAELAAQHWHWADIVETLKSQGCPTLLATKVAKDAWVDWCGRLGARVRRRSTVAALMVIGTIVSWNIAEAIPRSLATLGALLGLASLGLLLVALWIFFISNIRDLFSTLK